MAFDIGNLGDGNGKVYIRLKTGAINTLPNEPNQVMAIMLDAVKSRLIYSKYTEATGGSFTDQFQDNDWGTRYYLNAEVAAPVGDITGALDITKYVIDAQKCYKDNLTISSDEVTIVRYSFFHLIILTPETGTSDVLNYLNHDLQPGDMVFITLADDTNDTVIIQSHQTADGNFKLQNNQDIVLKGPGSCAMFIRDASTAQLAGGKGFLREIGRPDQQALGVANKTLTAGGGSYYILDVGTPDAARIDTKRGFVILHGNGTTLLAPWYVTAESTLTARSQGATLDIVLEGVLYTDRDSNAVLSIFNLTIPDWACQTGNVYVRAWYDDSDADPLNWEWKAKLISTYAEVQDTLGFLDSGASGEVIGIDYGFVPTAYLSASNYGYIRVEQALSIGEALGWINFGGHVVMDSTIVVNDTQVIADSTGTTRFIPNVAWKQRVLVLHAAGGGTWGEAVMSMTNVYPNEISLTAVGANLEPGDNVYLDGVRYLADGAL